MSEQPPDAPDLRAVIPVGADFGEVEGSQCTLTSVEVWSSLFIVQLLWIPETPWVQLRTDAVERDEPLPQRQWLARWSFADDLGGRYSAFSFGVGASGFAHMMTEKLEVRSPLPPDADVLSLAFQHDGGVAQAQLSLREGAVLAAPDSPSPRRPHDDSPQHDARTPSRQAPQYRRTIPVAADLGVADGGRLWLVAVNIVDPCLEFRFVHAQPPDHDAMPRIEWSLSDDVGTAYEQSAGRGWGSEGVGCHHRRCFWPSPPEHATMLTLTGHWHDEVLRHQIPLALPPRE